MEARFVLSSIFFPDLPADVSQEDVEARFEEVLDEIAPTLDQTTRPVNTSVANITFSVLDEAGNTVANLQPGQEYNLRVFVKDTRSLRFASTSNSGVFAGFVDVFLDDGLSIPRPPILSPDFLNLPSLGTERATAEGTVLEKVGAVKTVLRSPGTKDRQWLFDAPLAVDQDFASEAASISVRPSTVDESFLLFGTESPVDPSNVVPLERQFPVSQIIETPPPPQPDPQPPLTEPQPLTEPSPLPPTDEDVPTAQLLVSSLLPSSSELSSASADTSLPTPDRNISSESPSPFFDWLRSPSLNPQSTENGVPDPNTDEDSETDDGMIELDVPKSDRHPSDAIQKSDPIETDSEEEDDEQDASLFSLEHLWGIADLLAEDQLRIELSNPLLGRYRMWFRLYAPEPLHEPTDPSLPETSRFDGMVDVAELLRPTGPPRDFFSEPESRIAINSTIDLGSRSASIRFELDSMFELEPNEMRVDRKSPAPQPPPRPMPDDLSTLKAPSIE